MMLKNFLISLSTAYIVICMDFWRFYGKFDKAYVFIAIVMILFVAIESTDEYIAERQREYMIKKRRAEKFAREVKELIEKEDLF